MSANLDEVERLLGVLVGEQRKLLELLKRQKTAMAQLDYAGMEAVICEQEAVRTRMAATETRRKAMAMIAAKELRIPLAPNTHPTLAELASGVTDPKRRARLMALREELRVVANEVSGASQVAGRLAGSVLGHLNTAMRLLSTAMKDAGTYTRSGAPRIGSRLGSVEMVG